MRIKEKYSSTTPSTSDHFHKNHFQTTFQLNTGVHRDLNLEAYDMSTDSLCDSVLFKIRVDNGVSDVIHVMSVNVKIQSLSTKHSKPRLHHLGGLFIKRE